MNARDLGGMRTADGKVIKNRKLIRSGKLSKIPQSTAIGLSKYGVTTIVDLRIENERNAGPDRVHGNFRYIHLPILCCPAGIDVSDYPIFEATQKESTRAKKEGKRIKSEFGNSDNYMIEVYRSIVFEKQSQEALSEFLKLVREEEGCVLWHCASGKDRAAICTMLLLSLLGVDENTILADYMLSAKYCRNRYNLNKIGIYLVPFSIDLKRILLCLMKIKVAYLKTVMDDIKERYGGVVQYCKAELGVTEQDIAILKEKYLE